MTQRSHVVGEVSVGESIANIKIEVMSNVNSASISAKIVTVKEKKDCALLIVRNSVQDSVKITKQRKGTLPEKYEVETERLKKSKIKVTYHMKIHYISTPKSNKISEL